MLDACVIMDASLLLYRRMLRGVAGAPKPFGLGVPSRLLERRYQIGRISVTPFGNPATSERPVALRPRLAAGLPLSRVLTLHTIIEQRRGWHICQVVIQCG